MSTEEVSQEARVNLIIIIAVSVMLTLLLSITIVGLNILEEHLQRKGRIELGCDSPDNLRLQQCGGDGEVAR